MKYELSEHAVTTTRERNIEAAWIDEAMNAPDLEMPHETDATLRYRFKRIAARDDRVLRVIINVTKEPPVIVTAYFDRSMKGKA